MTLRSFLLLCAAASLAGCATAARVAGLPEMRADAVYPQKTRTQRALEALPPPARPVAVAVYGFTDQTGMFKPSEAGQTLSRAVSQGGGSIVAKALQDAGRRQWFTIVERESLRNLLNERQIIREMRERYLGEKDVNAQALPALLFAGVLLEGGIVGYDTNTVTGGAGAGFLGISARTEYRQDTVTVYLRAVSVRTGEVLTTVTASKTIASRSLGTNAFAFVGFKELLEAELGVTTNEPDQVALQQAIEKAVYGLVLEGVELKLWDFADKAKAAALLDGYRRERDGTIPAAVLMAAMRRADAAAPEKIRPRDVATRPSADGGAGRTGAQ
ncbi:CsgG/HfaB family protein [uncultured Sphingomonas sp.]|uniref:CsgG/HfaB family protein n=1 Tax=uncultured Sphingomonas sp. TaxID=158754 RepID=UPI0035CB1CDA